MSMNVRDVMKATDWELFREQKIALQWSISQYPELEGLLEWIDAVQDAVVDEGIATAEEVFCLTFNDED